MRHVCSALYERQHALLRAFNYLDVSGDGYISVADFEQAILLVMTHVRPRGRHDAGAERASKRGAAVDGDGARHAELHGIDSSQVAALVDSLKGSHLLIESKDPPQVDYLAFIQAFEVVDTQPEP